MYTKVHMDSTKKGLDLEFYVRRDLKIDFRQE